VLLQELHQQLVLVMGTLARRLGTVALLAALASPAAAAPRRAIPAARAPAHDARREKLARGHFERAEKAFNLGHFDEALTGYRAAYEALPLPAFLFNIAQCHRNLGEREQAIFFYQRYLSLEPNAPNRTVVEELIADQQRLLAAQNQPPPVEDKPVDLNARPPIPSVMRVEEMPPAKKESRISPKWWMAGVLGAAVLGGVTVLIIRSGGSLPNGALGSIDAR
jgi:tetratricopeptide (TPR) repeat protein